MEINDTQERYGIVSRTFHWGMALVMIVLWSVGMLLANQIIPQESRGAVMGIHKSVGVSILCLTLLRIFWRLCAATPPSSAHFPKGVRILSQVNTSLFYGLMIIFPLSGITMTLASGRSLVLFGATIISPLPENWLSGIVGDMAHQTHEICGYLFIAALFLHLCGVIFHNLILKDKLIQRMWGK